MSTPSAPLSTLVVDDGLLSLVGLSDEDRLAVAISASVASVGLAFKGVRVGTMTDEGLIRSGSVIVAVACIEGIRSMLSLHTALLCHLLRRVNWNKCQLGCRIDHHARLTRPRPPLGPTFSHLLSPYTHPSTSVASSFSQIVSPLGTAPTAAVCELGKPSAILCISSLV